MESYAFGSVSDAALRFALLAAGALLAGCAAFALCAYPAFRGAYLRRFRYLRLLGIAIAAGVTLTILSLIY